MESDDDGSCRRGGGQLSDMFGYLAVMTGMRVEEGRGRERGGRVATEQDIEEGFLPDLTQERTHHKE